MFAGPFRRAFYGTRSVSMARELSMLNQVLIVWKYEDLADFEKSRAKRDADPGWSEYRRQYGNMIVRQEDKIMEGAPFSPLR